MFLRFISFFSLDISDISPINMRVLGCNHFTQRSAQNNYFPSVELSLPGKGVGWKEWTGFYTSLRKNWGFGNFVRNTTLERIQPNASNLA